MKSSTLLKPLGSLALTALLGACSSGPKPLPAGKVAAAALENGPAAPSWVFSPADATLACVGDRLRETKTQPLIIGYAVTDATGRTGMELNALARASLGKVAARGNNLRITNMGFGMSAKPEVPSIEERELALRLDLDPTRATRLVKPDIVLTGGVYSVTNAFLNVQKTAGVSARDVDLGYSGTRTVDLATMSLNFKEYDSGLDVPNPAEEVRIGYQVLSSAAEVGVFATGSLNGKHHEAGIRLGRTVAVSQLAEDGFRVGMDMAIAKLLATRYGIDLQTCPLHVPPLDTSVATRPLPTAADLPAIYRGMDAHSRIRWFQSVLATRGYAPGKVDGLLGQRTRDALARAAADLGLPPTGLPSDALFYQLAMRQLAVGQDPREPETASAVPARLHVQLQQPNAPYVPGVALRAAVVVPQAGHLNCWLLPPDGGPISMHPALAGRSTYTTAQAAARIPDPQDSGPHPRLVLHKAGSHELWCGHSRQSLAERLPAALRPGGSDKTIGLGALREAYRAAAGDHFIAEGSARFSVVEPVVQSRQ